MIQSIAIFCLWCGAPAAFDVAPGPAPLTILRWSEQAHLQVLFNFRLVTEFNTVAVAGTLEPLEALRRMLRRTHLRAEYTNARTVAVFEDQHYCHPEWGAAAPLPPCLPQPLTIRLDHEP
jgi:hypothetical protein